MSAERFIPVIVKLLLNTLTEAPKKGKSKDQQLNWDPESSRRNPSTGKSLGIELIYFSMILRKSSN